MNEAVITLKGACETKAGGAPPEGCISSLSREQFEKLTNALQQPDKPVPPEVKRRFATQYAKLLTFADAARELGLQNDPKVQEIYRFAMNQILAEQLNTHYTDEFSHPSDQQIQSYYDQNVKKYMEVTLQRIIVPSTPSQAKGEVPKPTEAEQKAYAEKIRAQWVAGEDPVKLQKEVMEHNGVTTTSPDVNVGARRPGGLPQAHEAVFELKANEISPVYSDQAASYIYKVLSVRQVPLSEVKTSISQTLEQQMFKDKIQQVQSAVTVTLNDAYFGPDVPQAPRNMMRPGGPMRGPGAPPMPPGAGPGAGAPPAAGATPPANSSTPSPK